MRLPGVSEGQIVAVMESFVAQFPQVALSCLPTMDGDYRETELGCAGKALMSRWYRRGLSPHYKMPASSHKAVPAFKTGLELDASAMGGKRIHSSPAARELKPLKPLLKWAGGKRWLRIADMFSLTKQAARGTILWCIGYHLDYDRQARS